jgi:hypothetical protein
MILRELLAEYGMTTPDYETSFDAWAAQQAAALRAKDWAALDLEHLADEVEDLRKVERNAICSRLRLAVSPLLKWRYQPERRSESWRGTIIEARRRVGEDLESSRNLVRELDAFLAWAYPAAGAKPPRTPAYPWRPSLRPARGRSRRCWTRTSGRKDEAMLLNRCHASRGDIHGHL